MKKAIPFMFIILFMLSNKSYSQTNVSGGIYSNTTWTKAKSPYIVTDTVVVFPGVTLTIQPGVTIKFNTKSFIEVREGKVIAIGTKVDSINFIGKDISNTCYLIGGNLISEFNFCCFRSLAYGIVTQFITSNKYNSVIIKNSSFINNNSGIYDINGDPPEPYGVFIIDSCVFKNNN